MNQSAPRPPVGDTPGGAGARDINPAHRPSGLELDALGTGDEVRREEQAAHDRLPRVFRLLDTVLKVVMVALLVVLLGAVGANVFGRFVLNRSLPATDELARFLFIWVIFIGAALAHLHNEHIAVTLFVEKLPPSLQRIVVVVQEVIIVVVMVFLLIGAQRVLSLSPGTSALLNVPLRLISFSVPFSAALIGVISLYRIGVALRGPVQIVGLTTEART